MTDFEKKVLRETLKVPLGETITYKELARRCGRPRAWRAAANALKKNPWTLLVPCHRVIAGNGRTGGYSGGPARKKELIKLEKVIKDMIE